MATRTAEKNDPPAQFRARPSASNDEEDFEWPPPPDVVARFILGKIA
jgi:hypothetical protein